jgi:hypothetical protein
VVVKVMVMVLVVLTATLKMKQWLATLDLLFASSVQGCPVP